MMMKGRLQSSTLLAACLLLLGGFAARAAKSPCAVADGCAAQIIEERPKVTGITINKHVGASGKDFPIILVRLESANEIPADSMKNAMEIKAPDCSSKTKSTALKSSGYNIGTVASPSGESHPKDRVFYWQMSKTQVPAKGIYTISGVSVEDNVVGQINYGTGCYPMPTQLERRGQVKKEIIKFDNTFTFEGGGQEAIVDINMPPIIEDMAIVYSGPSTQSFNRQDRNSVLQFVFRITDPRGSGVCKKVGCASVTFRELKANNNQKSKNIVPDLEPDGRYRVRYVGGSNGAGADWFNKAGAWRVDAVTVMDVQGNYQYYGHAQLKALGYVVGFTVTDQAVAPPPPSPRPTTTQASSAPTLAPPTTPAPTPPVPPTPTSPTTPPPSAPPPAPTTAAATPSPPPGPEQCDKSQCPSIDCPVTTEDCAYSNMEMDEAGCCATDCGRQVCTTTSNTTTATATIMTTTNTALSGTALCSRERTEFGTPCGPAKFGKVQVCDRDKNCVKADEQCFDKSEGDACTDCAGTGCVCSSSDITTSRCITKPGTACTYSMSRAFLAYCTVADCSETADEELCEDGNRPQVALPVFEHNAEGICCQANPCELDDCSIKMASEPVIKFHFSSNPSRPDDAVVFSDLSDAQKDILESSALSLVLETTQITYSQIVNVESRGPCDVIDAESNMTVSGATVDACLDSGVYALVVLDRTKVDLKTFVASVEALDGETRYETVKNTGEGHTVKKLSVQSVIMVERDITTTTTVTTTTTTVTYTTVKSTLAPREDAANSQGSNDASSGGGGGGGGGTDGGTVAIVIVSIIAVAAIIVVLSYLYIKQRFNAPAPEMNKDWKELTMNNPLYTAKKERDARAAAEAAGKTYEPPEQADGNPGPAATTDSNVQDAQETSTFEFVLNRAIEA